ncbi:unnamed protein product [Vicia faba]|uniref:DUF4218 domain-containing protein n=1 Tax=Vicia faba TaxID=3906 RepID=A0AAV0ZZA5_VICFA|nr:unnamed protein product [Vicia faba]
MLTGDQVFEKVKDMSTQFGKPFANTLVKGGWKKSVIGTLLNIQGKSKDGLKARKDLIEMGIRSELGPMKKGTRIYLPPTAYTLSIKEKKNIVKMIDPEILPILQKEIVITLCELEIYFPPSFFDIMVHLVVHLVKETQLRGPAYMRWTYLVKRYMKILKGYVKNQSRPEGCMVERYIVEEAVDFCTEYLTNVQSIGLPKSHILERKEGINLIKNKIVTVSRVERDQVHLYVLHNNNEVELYVEMHKDVLRGLNPNRNENWIIREHNQSFIQWFKDHIYSKFDLDLASIIERLRCLAYGLSLLVFSYSAYTINGCTFYTKEQDDKSTVQNSGVTVVAEAMHISSMNDLNHKYANLSYFGVIEHIWMFDYEKFQIPIFGCKWVYNSGIRMDKSGLLQVDLNRVGYKDEPFILASQAKQVFYVTDLTSTKWSIVLLSKKVIDDNSINQSDVDVENESYVRKNESYIRNDQDENIIADETYIRNDHNEGIWIIHPSKLLRSKLGLETPCLPLFVLLGIFVWTLAEYLLHRFLFHVQTKSYWGNTLHYLLHGCHHKHPMDSLRLVFPPAAAAIIASMIVVASQNHFIISSFQVARNRFRLQSLLKIISVGLAIGDGLTDPITQVVTHAANAYYVGLINKKQKNELEKAQLEVVRLVERGNWSEATDARNNALSLLCSMTGLATLFDYCENILVQHSRSATRISRAATLNLNCSTMLTMFASHPLLRGSSTQVFFIFILLLKMSFPRLFMLEFIVVKVAKELFEM